MSLPTRERELKLDLLEEALVDYRSLPTRERELKPFVVDGVFEDSGRSLHGSVN